MQAQAQREWRTVPCLTRRRTSAGRDTTSRWGHPTIGTSSRVRRDGSAAEVWEPLVAVADLAGGTWPAAARAAAVALTDAANHAEVDHSAGTSCCSTCATVLAATRGDFITTEASAPGSPFQSHVQQTKGSRNDAWRPASRTTASPADNPATANRERGFRRTNFTDAFDRYVQPSGPAPAAPNASGTVRGGRRPA